MRLSLGFGIGLSLLLCSERPLKSDPSPSPLAVEALIVVSSEVEAQPFIDKLTLSDLTSVPGLATAHPAVRCNASGVCVLVTGSGKAAAAASVAAVIASRKFDLSKTYFVIAGVGAIDPGQGTVGSVAWAANAVDSGIAWEIDARSLPSGWSTGYLGILTSSPSDKPSSSFGTELFPLDSGLSTKALALSQAVTLEDAPGAIAYRANYAAAPANLPPKVIACDTSTSDTLGHGALLGVRVHDWTDAITDHAGTYCTSQRSANAVLAALARGGDAGVLDPKRAAVVFAASRFDRQYPAQTAADSLAADAGGDSIAVDNLYLVVSALVSDIVKNWSAWQSGVPK